MLAVGCALLALAMPALLAPAFVAAQAAEDEYDLSLPGSSGATARPPAAAMEAAGGGSGGGGAGTPTSGADGSSTGDSAGSAGGQGGGAPVALIILAAVAAVGIGFAVWRLRGRSAHDAERARARVHGRGGRHRKDLGGMRSADSGRTSFLPRRHRCAAGQ